MNKHSTYDPRVSKPDSPKAVAIIPLFLRVSVSCFVASVIVAAMNWIMLNQLTNEP